MTNLFKVREENEQDLLKKKRAKESHHTVAQLLFTGIRCRKDVQTAMSFLTTRVRHPDKDNWKKLRRLLGYLKITIKLPLVI